MIEINLLPRGQGAAPHRRSSSKLEGLASALTPRLEAWVIGLGVSASLVVLLAGWSWWSTSAAAAHLETEIGRELEDSIHHASALERFAVARARQDTLERKIEFLRSTDADRFLWPRLLEEISAAVPPSTWLTRLGSTDGADAHGPVVVIEGASASTQLLTHFMKNLEASTSLREVTLVTTEQAAGMEQDYSRFVLEARHDGSDRAEFGERSPGARDR